MSGLDKDDLYSPSGSKYRSLVATRSCTYYYKFHIKITIVKNPSLRSG